MTQKQEVSKCCWENGASRLAQGRVPTNLQLKKKKGTFAKGNKVNQIKSSMPIHALAKIIQSFKKIREKKIFVVLEL